MPAKEEEDVGEKEKGGVGMKENREEKGEKMKKESLSEALSNGEKKKRVNSRTDEKMSQMARSRRMDKVNLEKQLEREDIKPEKPMQYSIMEKEIASFKFLLQRSKDINETNSKGWTALHFACFTGQKSFVEALLEKGALVHIKDKHQQSPIDVRKK